jgi:hypothetical protein
MHESGLDFLLWRKNVSYKFDTNAYEHIFA